MVALPVLLIERLHGSVSGRRVPYVSEEAARLSSEDVMREVSKI